ncbi:hypothetical protein [Jatrophihabitans lederbergiae]|uniref:Uncharacterized protein n=1 Tax=Jatrophihabitans lederbergiae TaxID=3075547 RepID=A0ABU2J8R6_9ACTN|nr:hypothetical protein [Jatrophihabitans sp. DSM 44399]MDT0261352.1 hypothetical protein [Jatrophihabitans sp. DSM 44399]
MTELGHALGYWAARWAPLPRTRPAGIETPATAWIDSPVPDRGGARTGLAHLWVGSRWPIAAARMAQPRSAEAPAALDQLVDAAVTTTRPGAAPNRRCWCTWPTAPRAARLVLPALPPELWPMTYRHAWTTSAAIASMYRPKRTDPFDHSATRLAAQDIADRAAATGDAHAIKFTEVTLQSHRRGNPIALRAAETATALSND